MTSGPASPVLFGTLSKCRRSSALLSLFQRYGAQRQTSHACCGELDFDLLVLLVLFLALFLSLGAVLLQLPGLIHRKREHQEAQSLSDTRLVLWVFSTFAVSWFSTFFFSVTSDITAEALRGFGMGEYLYDFPAALIFFYVAGPAIVVNVAFGSWVRGNIRRLLSEV